MLLSREFLVGLVVAACLCSHLGAAGPAGGGSADVAAPTGELERVWTRAFRGTLEGDPLVAGEVVLVSIASGRSQRQLLLVDGETGRVLDRRTFPSSTTLSVATFGRTIAVRADVGRVEFLRHERGRFTSGLRHEGTVASPPSFTERGLAVFHLDGELVGVDPREARPRWSIPGAWRGSIAVRDERAFAVRYERGVAILACIDARLGRVLAEKPIGDHGGAEPLATDRGPEPCVVPDAVWVLFDRDLRSSSTAAYSTSRVERTSVDAFGDQVALHALLGAPLEIANGVIYKENHPDGERWVLDSEHAGGVRVLADDDHATELVDSAPIARGGGLLYLGRDVVDAVTLVVRERLPYASFARPVPLDHGVLLTKNERTLELYRADPPESRASRRAAALADEVDRRLAEGYAALARLATDSHDPKLVSDLIEEAQRRGASEGKLAATRRTLELWRRASRKRDVNAAAARSVHSRREQLDRAGDAELVSRSREESPTVRRIILDELLRRTPGHAGAIEEIARSAPFGIDEVAKNPRGWLALTTLEDEGTLVFVDDRHGSRAARERLATERARWSRSLIAVETDTMILVGPKSVPEQLALGVRLGELVSKCLDQLFDVRTSHTRSPLTLLVHADQASYRAFAGDDIQSWSAGFYDPNENVCRLFVPDDTRATERFRSTYVHELVHHWISTRAPFVRSRADRSGESDSPAFWLCEGFATMLEEYQFDLERGTWRPADERASSLDVIAHATESELLPWTSILSLTQEDFLRLADDNRRVLTRRYVLGGSTVASDKRLFYMQSAAVAHHLVQNDQTPELLRALEGWYTDRGAATDARGAFGRNEAALGRSVKRWAESLDARKR